MSAALVVVESMWGNTRAVADVVAAGLGHQCPVLDVSEAPAALPADLRLLVVGGPTHALSMTRQRTRKGAVEQGAPDVHTELGIREWLATLPTSGGWWRARASTSRGARVPCCPASWSARGRGAPSWP
jgi:hypothetical protein